MATSISLPDSGDTLPTNPAVNKATQDYVVSTPLPTPARAEQRVALDAGIISPPWVMYADGLDIKGPKYNSFIASGNRLMQATDKGWPYSVAMVANEDKYIHVVFDTDTGKFNDDLVKSDTFAPSTVPNEKYYVLGRAIADANGIVTWYQQAASSIWDYYQTSFLAKLTAETSGVYSWTRLQDDGVSLYSPTITGTEATELNGTKGIADDTVVRLWRFDGVSGVEHKFHAPSILFPIVLSAYSGVAGDETTQCAFVYTVEGLNGEELGTSVSPAQQRPPIGAIIFATIGTCYYTAAGALVLHWCDEHIDPEVCS